MHVQPLEPRYWKLVVQYSIMGTVLCDDEWCDHGGCSEPCILSAAVTVVQL